MSDSPPFCRKFDPRNATLVAVQRILSYSASRCCVLRNLSSVAFKRVLAPILPLLLLLAASTVAALSRQLLDFNHSNHESVMGCLQTQKQATPMYTS